MASSRDMNALLLTPASLSAACGMAAGSEKQGNEVSDLLSSPYAVFFLLSCGAIGFTSRRHGSPDNSLSPLGHGPGAARVWGSSRMHEATMF